MDRNLQNVRIFDLNESSFHYSFVVAFILCFYCPEFDAVRSNHFCIDADAMGIDKSFASRVAHRFCEAIVSNRNQFICSPGTDDDKTEKKTKFFDIGGFSSWVGRIDGFAVRTCTPHQDDNDFANRKS